MPPAALGPAGHAGLVATTDYLAIGVTVVATLVVVALLAAVAYLLASVRELRRQSEALAEEAQQLLDELGETVRQAGVEVDRVDRLVGSAEAISDAVGSASRLVGGVVAEPLIKLVALASGLARVARVVRGRGAPRHQVPAVARESRGGKARSDSPARARRAFGRRPPALERAVAASSSNGNCHGNGKGGGKAKGQAKGQARETAPGRRP